MNDDEAVKQLIDRQAILDCLTRYCRGVDRGDDELIESAYHSDAFDDHGAFAGSPAEFTKWVGSFRGQISRQHHLTTHSCDLDGDTAHTETYFLYTARNENKTVRLQGGRYLDRFEKRGGEWRIAMRYCVVEWDTAVDEGPLAWADIPDLLANGVPGRNRDDPSYRRPLENMREGRTPQRAS